jgi:hypothetical protein
MLSFLSNSFSSWVIVAKYFIYLPRKFTILINFLSSDISEGFRHFNFQYGVHVFNFPPFGCVLLLSIQWPRNSIPDFLMAHFDLFSFRPDMAMMLNAFCRCGKYICSIDAFCKFMSCSSTVFQKAIISS